MTVTGPRLRAAIVIGIVGLAAAAAAVVLFPRAFPTIALENRLTQATALARADSFFGAHELAPPSARRAVRFRADDSLLTYVDLAAGGPDSVNALIRGRDAALFIWSVRAFTPNDIHEARVDLAPDGRVIGFRRKLAQADKRPDVGADSATSLARMVLTTWIGESADRWRAATTSYETRKVSDRKDRTVTFERTDRKIGDAPLRLDVVIAGDTPVQARPYVYVPEAFNRRYGEMRSANGLLALFDNVAVLGLVLLGVWSLRTHSRARLLRWREPIWVGAVIGALLTAAALNAMGSSWYDYDTAMPSGLFEALQLGGALIGSAGMGGVIVLTLAAAEAAARGAFPRHLDWWKLWRSRGTGAVAAQVAGGYVVAAIGFAYVAAFYVFTRHALGWWVPSELLDDPNQIATPMPWLTGVAWSLQAGVWEESLFRALPLSLLALWTRGRPASQRKWWMAGGVVVTALVFGFAHASYPSWPAYSRGVELFVEASFWAVLFLRFGLLVTVVGHFTYDLVLFSLFAATGTATEYRVVAAIAGFALVLPALVIGWRAVRQRGFTAVPDDARFGAWSAPAEPATPADDARPIAPGPLSARSKRIASLAAIVAVIAAIAVPRAAVRGPDYTADRARAITAADSLLAARGAIPGAWRRLTGTATDTLTSWPRFLRENHLDSLAAPLATTYAVPAWWVVRYVHTAGAAAERVEEWQVRVFPDGRPLDVHHIVADSARGDAPSADSVRRIARHALAAAGIDTLRLRETQYDETKRPHRRDATVTWADTTVPLPNGASARAWVTLAGSEPLVTRRGVELPEPFRRAERERMTRTSALSGLFGLLLIGGVIGGAIFVGKRRAPVVSDRTFDRTTARVLLVVLAAATLAGSLNSLPGSLLRYDTAEPWSDHVITTAVLTALSLFGPLVLAGIWVAFEMLRCRAGIAAWPDGASGQSPRDAVLAGVGLGAVTLLGLLLPGAARTATVGASPTTTLDRFLPFADGVLSLPTAVAAQVAIPAIPLLVILALTRRNRTRWLLVVFLFALVAAILGPTAVTALPTPLTVTQGLLGAVAAAAVVLAFRWWGARGACTWLVAALTTAALGQLRTATHAATAPESASGALAVVAALAAIAWVARTASTKWLGTRPSSASQSATTS